MSLSFRSAGFAAWVADFVAWSNDRAGIRRPPTPAEIGAHRGLFAQPRLGPGHVALFLRHVVGDADLRAQAGGDLALRLAELGSGGTDIERWLRAFGERHPLERGDGRCARALWMWHHAALGRSFADVVLGETSEADGGEAPGRRTPGSGEGPQRDLRSPGAGQPG